MFPKPRSAGGLRLVRKLQTVIEKKIYTGCPGRNVPDFGKMFLKLKYTDLTKNTYIKS